MTYEEVALRMVRLMYVAHQERWIDISLRNLTGDWLRRVEERFAGVNGDLKPSVIQSYTLLDKPHAFIESFFGKYPAATEQLLASEDKTYFLAISQCPGQKPAPFIPILDANIEVWFKRDSLWAAEDIDAVFDQDPQRVCILQGPVTVKHSTVKDEPIKDMLGNITAALVEKLTARLYDGDESKIPTAEYLAPVPRVLPPVISPTISKTTPWPELTWARALLTSTTIVQGTAYIDNHMRRLFAPRRGQIVVVETEGSQPKGISLYGAARSHGKHTPEFKAVDVTFDAATLTISVTLFEERRGSSIAHDRNQRIKAFYWKVWFSDNEVLPELGLRDTFTSPEVTIDEDEIDSFCAVIGNQGEAFKSVRNETPLAPMDFSIVAGWQSIMKAIFPAPIDGDLLKLVHLSNGFRLLNGAKPLQAGDVCHSEVRVIAVVNGNAGKTVKVKGYILRDGERVIEVTSSFLYRGRFNDYQNTFETLEEPDYLVELESDADVGVLQSKEWFEGDDKTKPLQAGTALIFRVRSEVTYRNKTCYKAVNVSGEVFVRDQIKRLVKVGTIDFLQDDSRGNPVVAYLERHGKPQCLVSPLSNDSYTMTVNASTTFTSPATNEPYSKTSGDFNPIHINPYFADYVSLPGTITHGMWSSAAPRRYVETVVAQGKPERVVAYDVAFVGMVLPGDEMQVKIKHVGMRDGNFVVNVETSNSRGEKVLAGTAKVAQPTTGSQEPGMGMDLYNNLPAARSVWDAADAHLTAVYGFSIVEIVKDNPKEKTIHFGGIKGQAIRQRYMDMTYDMMDKDGNVKTLPLFGDINVRTQRYTFSHPNGLLFATQFAQIALVVTERAAFEDMRSKGLVQKESAFAGHSLGEYSALASIADVLAISSLVDAVFYRGITMQRAVEHDSQNRSNYAMCAVNPSRISKTFNDAALREVVESIAQKTGCLLEIVNFNVEGQQYICAGELVALQTMTNVLNYMKIEKVDIAKLTEKFTVDQVKEMLGDIIISSFDKAKLQQAKEGYIKLERGFATIPLPGIDVLFHSRYLWAGVMPFRAYLSKKINPAHLNSDTLVGKYVPNLVAKPFDVSKEYAQLIYDQTLSPRLDKVLRKWDQDNWGAAEQRQKLAYIILVELLAYQFASPSSSSAPAAAPVAAAPVAAALAPTGIAMNIEDAPLKATDVLVAIVAQKLKKKVEEISLSKSIKDLVGGKSTMQNEIVGDLQLEFQSAPEKGEELPLEELGSALGVGFSGTLGKYTSGLISCLIGGKIPVGFNLSKIKMYVRVSAACALHTQELSTCYVIYMYVGMMHAFGVLGMTSRVGRDSVQVCHSLGETFTPCCFQGASTVS
ncbi:acyl transferase domain-containing protein [Trametes gibbosa]|nr:acyl transferase domain-containing protein [Trametes gibbosa]